MGARDNMPDFLVIGAGKSGTTSLNNYLKQHPQVFMCLRKEPNFFALEIPHPDDYELQSSRDYYYQSVSDIDEYQKLFQGAREDQLLGEVSNTYLNSELACDRIQHYLPGAKLIAILRHPAERLYSRYYHLVREDVLDNLTWDQLFDRNTEWWKRQDLVDEGFYYKHLKRYYDNFPAENIMPVLYEDFTEKTGEVVREIFKFLEVDTDADVDTETVYNKSGEVKNESVNKVVGQNSGPIRALRNLAPGLHKKLKSSPLANRLLYYFRNKNLEKPSMPADLRKKLIEEIYREDIEKLQKLIGKDLSHWLKA